MTRFELLRLCAFSFEKPRRNAPGFGSNVERNYAAIAFFFLRQPSRPSAPRPVAKSGKAPGSGTGEKVGFTLFSLMIIPSSVSPTKPPNTKEGTLEKISCKGALRVNKRLQQVRPELLLLP